MNNIKVFENDLPDIDLSDEKIVSLDCEALGLVLGRDPLTLVQIGLESKKYFLIKLNRSTYHAPNLQGSCQIQKPSLSCIMPDKICYGLNII